MMGNTIRILLFLGIFCNSIDAQSFTTKAIAQTMPLAGGSNTITVTFSSSVTLTGAAGSVITITGLDNAVATSPVTLLSVSGGQDAHQKFEVAATSERGAFSAGTLTLTLSSGESVTGGQTYAFAFVVTNPSTAQGSPGISIAATGSATIAAAAMTKTSSTVYSVSGGTAALFVVQPTFSLAFITQIIPLTGVENFLFFFVTPSTTIPAGSIVEIFGLNGTTTPDEPTCFQLQNFPNGVLFGPGACATWVQSTGTLTMTIQSELSPSETYQVIFSIRNPFEEQSSPDVQITGSIVADGPTDAPILPLSMTKDTSTTSGIVNGAEVLFVVKPTFTVRSIAQDNPFALSSNTITATLQFNTDVPVDSQITISGLSGSSTATTASLPVTITPSVNQAFSSTAAWNNAGNLIITASSLEAFSGITYTVAWTLTNGASGQPSPTVLASGFVNSAPGFENGALTESQFATLAMTKPVGVDLFGIPNGSHPLQIVVPFDIKNITQSSPIIGNVNTITVTLQASADLLASDGTTVTIFGLVQTDTASTTSLALTYPDATLYFGTTAKWAQSSGRLTLTQAVATIAAGDLLSFSFDLTNPATSQSSPSIFINGTGTTTILTAEMTRAADLLAPLAVMGLATKRIVQDTSAPSFSNTITVTLSFTTNLPSTNTIVTITNLTGAAGPDVLSFSGDTSFLNVRSWDRPEGVLEIDVLQSLTALTDYTVSFFVSNPEAGQPGPNVSISVTVDGLLVVNGIDMDRGDGTFVGSEPLLINEFVFSSIGQTDPGQGVVNTIVVTVATRAELFNADNTFFIICNLQGTTTTSGSLTIADVGGSGSLGLFGSTADWTSGTVTINFQAFGDHCLEANFDGVDSNSIARKKYTFKFELTNPLQSQEGPQPITMSAFFRERFSQTFLFDVQMTRGTGINEPLLVNGFLDTSISQSTASTSLTNIISVSFRARAPFPTSGIITISNLDGAVNPTGSLILNDDSGARNFFADASGASGRGAWDNSSKSLLLYVANETVRNATYDLSFNVTNPSRGQLPPAVSIESNGNASLIYPIEIGNASYLFDRAMAVFGWKTRMGQTNPLAGAENTLGITLSSVITTGDNPIPTLNIRVLEGAEAPSGNLTLEDSSAVCGAIGSCLQFFSAFRYSGTGLGSWDNASKVLTIHATQELFPGTYFFTFNVTNAQYGQFSPAIKVETIGYNYRSLQRVGKDAGNLAPLAISDFNTRAIGQSDAQLNAVNTISVTLISTLTLSASNSFVTISGLSGSVTPSSASFPVSNQTTATGAVFGSVADWDRNGTLVLQVLDTIRANEAYIFTFVLTNPAQGQQSPPVFISLSGDIPIDERAMQRAPNVQAPLFVVEITVASAAQNTPLANLNNVITVTLQTNFDVSPGAAYIAIFPLSNAVVGASIQLDAVAGGNDAAALFSDGSTQGTAAFANDVLRLYVATGKTLLRDTLYQFSFNVTNPALTQLAPLVSVEKRGPVFNVTSRKVDTVDGFILGVANGTNPLRVVSPEFTIRAIAQSAPFSSVANAVTITLKPNVNLAYGDASAITISASPATPWDNVISSSSLQLQPVAGGNSGELKLSNGSLPSTASFSSGSIVLRIAFNETLAAEVTYAFSFSVTNPSFDQTAPLGVSIEASGTAVFLPQQMQVPNAQLKGVPNGTNFGTVVVPRWLVARGAQSTFEAATINTITVTLQINVELSSEDNSIISILNLENAIATNPVTLNPVPGGNDANLLFSDLSGSPAGRAVLGADRLHLTVATNQTVSSSLLYIFSFNITNPNTDQNAPAVSIEANGTATITRAAIDVPRIVLYGISNATDPLRVIQPRFTVRDIAQSDPLALRINTITVTLQTNVDLRQAEGSVISITGFENAIQNLSVTLRDTFDGNNASLLFSDGTTQGTASYASGTVTLFLFTGQTMFKDVVYKFAFNFVNPDLSQQIPPPRISATGTVTFREREMNAPDQVVLGVPNGTNPLNLEVTPVFLTAAAAQDSPIASAVNKITVTLRMNIILASADSSVITISNLQGATAGPSVGIIDEPGGNNASFFFSDGSTRRTGAFVNNTLRLFIFPGQTLGAQIDYIFSFNVTNPAQEQTYPRLFVAASGTVVFDRTIITVPNTPLKGIINASNPLLVVIPRFTISNIAQSTVVASSSNRITVTIQTNIDLAFEDNSRVVITPLSNAIATAPITLLARAGGNSGDQLFGDGVSSGFATFASASDSLILRVAVGQTVLINVAYVFAFDITNPSNGQDSPLVQIRADGGVPIADTNMSKAPNNNSPLLIADFTVRIGSQSTPSQKALNLITISLATRVDLFDVTTGVPTRLTISGLTGSNTSSGVLTVSGSVAFFGTSGTWNQGSGSLELDVIANTTARQVYTVNFSLLNPDFGQDSPQVNLSTSGIAIESVAVVKGSGNAAPLLVADFTTLRIGQASPSSGATNTITLTLATRADLSSANAVVSVTGLSGSHQYSSSVAVTSVSGLPAYSSTAAWDFVSGTAVLTLVADTVARQDYVISFDLTNPLLAQSSPAVTISAQGIFITPQAMSRGLNNSAPLLVAGFLAASLVQSTPDATASNQLQLVFSCNVILVSSTSITLTGLTGSSTADTSSLTIAGSVAEFGGSASWSNSGVIVFTTIADARAQEQFTLSFGLQNSGTGQFSPAISISSSGIVMLSAAVTKGTGNTAPMLIAGFRLNGIGQTTAQKNAINTIVVTLATFATHTVALSSRFTIVGLTGSATASATLSLTAISNGTAVFGTSAAFTQASGTLELTLVGDCLASRLHVFAFNLTNPSTVLASPSVAISASGVLIPLTGMNSGLGSNAPLLVITPEESKASCSNLQSWNRLNSSASTFVPRRGFGLVVRGGFQLRDIGGSGSTRLFTNEGSWIQSNGMIILNVARDQIMVAGTSYVFSVQLTNPLRGQTGPTVQVESRGSVTIAPATLTADSSVLSSIAGSVSGDKNPLQVYGNTFTQANIGQSTTFPGVTNTITVTIASALDLTNAGSCVVTIDGLTNTQTADNPTLSIVNVGAVDASTLFGGSGSWLQTTGSLALTIAAGQTMSAGVAYSFSWEVVNPSSAQGAIAASALSSGTPAIASTAMVGDSTTVLTEPGAVAGDARPLLVYGAAFVLKSIGQSTPYPGARNTLTLTLALNVQLSGRQGNIAVTGLTGSTPNSTTIKFSSNVNDTFANATWDSPSGSLALVFVPSGVIASNQTFNVFITVLNPTVAQSSPAVLISAGDETHSIASVPMDRDTTGLPTGIVGAVTGDSAPLKVDDPSFVLRQIGQSNPYPSVNNTITATLSPNYLLNYSDYSTIYMSGLTGSQTTDGTLDATGTVNQSVSWTQSGVLSMTLPLGFVLEPGDSFLLSFVLLNPSNTQTAASVSVGATASGSATFFTTPLLMTSDSTTVPPQLGAVAGDARPLRVLGPTFSQAVIGQSSSLPGMNNTLTVTIASALDLTASGACVITIAGLLNTLTPDTAALPIAENGPGNASTALFGGSGSWLQTTGSLALTFAAGQTMSAGVAYSFSWEVVNPSSAQSPAAVYLFSSGDPAIWTTSMVGDATTVLNVAGAVAGDARPLTVHGAGWLLKSIGQSTPYPGALNTITVTLASSVVIPGSAQSFVTISGLVATSRSDATLDVFGMSSNFSMPFEAIAQWIQVDGSLQLALLNNDLEAGVAYSASFQLRNPTAHQQGPTNVRVKLTSVVQNFERQLMDRDISSIPAGVTGAVVGDAVPLKVYPPTFILTGIGQSTAFQGAANTIYLTLTSNYNLTYDAGSAVTISGLTGARTADSETMVLVGGFNQTHFHNDVLASTDGETWSLLTAAPTWTAREGHALVLGNIDENQTLFLIAGRNADTTGGNYLRDVWRSADGVSWTRVGGGAFPARAYFGAAASGQNLYVVGGATNAPTFRLNDVWASSDGGQSWVEVTGSAAFAGRYGFAFVFHQSPFVAVAPSLTSDSRKVRTLVVCGGAVCEQSCSRYDNSRTGCETLSGPVRWECCVQNETCAARSNVNDVYASADFGATWELRTANGGWPASTFAFASSYFDGSLILAGGYESYDRFEAELWVGTDTGAVWTNSTPTAQGAKGFLFRSAGQLVQHGQCLKLVGGHTRYGAGTFVHHNDVWQPAT